MKDRLTNEEMRQLCPTLTAKTELVLAGNPVTGDEAMYERDGKDWVRLQGETGSAAPDSESGTAPLSGEVGPDRGPSRGDDVSAQSQDHPVVYPETGGNQPK